MSAKSKLKKEKSKIAKLIEKCDSDKEESEHELSHYINDRVKLMKEVLKIIKPKKIKTMAPECIKNLDIEEINSMLLEELLGISNKRLKYIFNGQNPGEDSSSSTDPEEERAIDIISLDDVSDDDFVVEVDTDGSKRSKNSRREEVAVKKIKKERKQSKAVNKPLQEENLMSVLELLELQARARAIRSQLMLETNKPPPPQSQSVKITEDSDTDDAVIIELPKHDEIVITSSESETERDREKSNDQDEDAVTQTGGSKKGKIKLIRNRVGAIEATNTAPENADKDTVVNETGHEDDEFILIVDQEEMDGIMAE